MVAVYLYFTLFSHSWRNYLSVKLNWKVTNCIFCQWRSRATPSYYYSFFSFLMSPFVSYLPSVSVTVIPLFMSPLPLNITPIPHFCCCIPSVSCPCPSSSFLPSCCIYMPFPMHLRGEEMTADDQPLRRWWIGNFTSRSPPDGWRQLPTSTVDS